MMRSWENRADTSVMDEPLYAAALATTGGDHPMRDEILAAGPSDPSDAITACVEAGAAADGGASRPISYQKHMAHHLLPSFDRSWLDRFVHVVLIRHPRRVLASYGKVWNDVSVEAIGLPQQLELAPRAAVVIDSDDFLTNPRQHLEAMCEALDVPFDESMLSWPAGTRESDGVWAPAWYSAVEASTEFGPAPSQSADSIELALELEPIAADALEIYRELHASRLVLT